jgi:hypothetical protein
MKPLLHYIENFHLVSYSTKMLIAQNEIWQKFSIGAANHTTAGPISPPLALKIIFTQFSNY